jgi:hypothetical protein
MLALLCVKGKQEIVNTLLLWDDAFRTLVGYLFPFYRKNGGIMLENIYGVDVIKI